MAVITDILIDQIKKKNVKNEFGLFMFVASDHEHLANYLNGVLR